MTTIHRHNPLLKQKLQNYVNTDDTSGLLKALGQLSATEFRTAGYLLAEELLPQLEGERFWHFFITIVPESPKAFLGTFLKSAVKLYKSKRLKINEEYLQPFAAQATQIDRHKTLDALLPVITTADEAAKLLHLFTTFQLEDAGPYLLRATTPASYYLLFNLLKTADPDGSTMRRYILTLMRKGDKISFNLASILCQYFDVKDIPGTFSLRLLPYQLSRLDQGESLFRKALLS